MRIEIASDHAGFDLKCAIVQFLTRQGIGVIDHGAGSASPEASADYPDYAALVAASVSRGTADRGILVCGTGLGMTMAANRFHGVRATLCHDLHMAKISRQHNDANILTLGGRVLETPVALQIVEVWLQTPFDGGRHKPRIQKIDLITKRHA